jgi:hypothetical protein
MLFCGTALAAQPKVGEKFTFVGKAENRVAHGEKGERINIYGLVKDSEGEYIILFDNVYNGTKQFVECYESSQTKNTVIEITAIVKSNDELKIDKSSTCKKKRK